MGNKVWNSEEKKWEDENIRKAETKIHEPLVMATQYSIGANKTELYKSALQIPNYMKFEEDKYLNQAKEYIESTYNQHYSNKYQAIDMIMDAGFGTGFNLGNIMKYAKRYGKKNGYNKNDLLKIIHYAILQMYVHEHELEIAKEGK